MCWVEDEYELSSLGDERLDRRAKRVLRDFSSSPTASIPSSMKSFSETAGAYRFFQNDKVTLENVLEPHKLKTIERVRSEREVLILQDTSELDFSSKQEKIEGLGRLNVEARRGLFIHPLLALTPDRLCLGVVGAQLYARGEKRSSAAKRKKTPIEDKESYRWIEGYNEACKVAEECPDTTVIVVADREADIHELFLEAEFGEAEWIVRAKHDRRLVDGDEAKYLFDTLENTKPLGEVVCNLAGKAGKKGREATLSIVAIELTPRGPYSNNKKLPEVKITAVMAMEKNPPKGEDPVRWYLLTSLSVKDINQARKVIDRYLCRWQIEVFFRTLKSGCKIERLQLEHVDRLGPCIGMYMIVTWRIMYCMMLGRECPEIGADLVFEDFEWKAAYAVATKKKPPSKPPTLSEMILLIASFGGYLNRKNDPPPGPKAMWVGMQSLFGYAVGFQTAIEIYGLG